MMKNQNKAITKEDLGNMLHKYINPLYERMDKMESEFGEVKKSQHRMESELDEVKKSQHRMESELDEVKKSQDRTENELDEVKRIQLRMEHRLDENIKILHDRDDSHDKKLKNHEKRIITLEGSI